MQRATHSGTRESVDARLDESDKVASKQRSACSMQCELHLDSPIIIVLCDVSFVFQLRLSFYQFQVEGTKEVMRQALYRQQLGSECYLIAGSSALCEGSFQLPKVSKYCRYCRSLRLGLY